MATIGINVRRDGSDYLPAVRALGASWIRIVATPENDLRVYFSVCTSLGIKVLLVLARESGGDYGRYRDLYGDLIDAIQVGNEADLDSSSSWTMSQLELASLGRAVRGIFPETPLVCSGLASGHPEWLEGMDLSWCDGVGVHPYAKDSENPTDLEDQPDMQPLLREYAKFGKPILVTEWGWPSDGEPRASEEVGDAISWAAGTSEIAAFFYFALGDDVPPFGLVGGDGKPKPKYWVFKNAIRGGIPSPWPSGSTPVPPPTPVPTLDPWQYFTAERISAALGANIDHVRLYWPKIVEQLDHAGINGRLDQIAVLATIAVEVGSRFEPIPEYASGAEYEGRADLGNTQPGDGVRYKGRGFVQITGRSNYRTYGQKVADLWGTPMVDALDLEAHPDLALDPDMAAAVLAVYFKERVPRMTDPNGDWGPVRYAVNGGYNGWQDFAETVEELKALPAPTPVPVPDPTPEPDETEALKLALRTLRDKTLPDALDELDAMGASLNALSLELDEVRKHITEATRITVQFAGST